MSDPNRGLNWEKIKESYAEFDKQFGDAAKDISGTLEKVPGFLRGAWESFINWTQSFWIHIWSTFRTKLDRELKAVWEFFTGAAFDVKNVHIDMVLEDLKEAGLLDADDIAAIKSITMPILNIPSFGGLLLKLNLYSSTFKAFFAVIDSTIIQKLNAKFSPAVPSPGEIIRTSFIAPELHEQVVNAMKRAGLSEDDIKLLYVANYSLYTPVDVRDLFLRGVITADKAIERLHELGFTDERIAEMTKLWEVIPPLSDVIRYLGKEVYEPKQIARFGLMEDYDVIAPEANLWAAKMGLDERWVKAEWISHWRDIGIQFVLEGFHRKKISWDWVERYMSLIEIPPGVRELVRDTAYSPYTRVDARRMRQMGVIDDAGLKQAFTDIGYDDEHADNLVKFTLADMEKEGNNLTRDDILEGYSDGDLSYQDAVALLEQTGWRTSYAEFLVTRIDLKIEKAHREAMAKSIKELFVDNVISETEVRTELIKLGYAAKKIDMILLEWGYSVVRAKAFASKTDLDKFLRGGVISESKYRYEMKRLGYPDEVVDWYYRIITKNTGG